MTTNPHAALRSLITFAIIIPLAVLMGYLLTNPLNYSTLFFVGLIVAMVLSPIFIKWHYPIMVFGLAFPAQLFFLKGNPPFWQVIVIISLGIAIVERATSSERRFLKAPPMTWAMLFTAAMVFITMKLTGGFGLHTVGGGTGGGRKYITLYLGIATFFALISRGIPPEKRRLYIGLFFLSGIFVFISDLYFILPGPLKYINLIFTPSVYMWRTEEAGSGTLRLAGLMGAANAIMLFMLARYGLRELLSGSRPGRAVLFILMFCLSLLGGFRSALIGNTLILFFCFFFDGLHRTKWLPIAAVGLLLLSVIVVPFARDLPESIQRCLAIFPPEIVKVDPGVRMDAEGSKEWRLKIWSAILPQVPDYLLLGKGYALTSEDYESIGEDNPFARTAQADASQESLAISNDFHSGPLSTVICFGLWGCISILAIMGAGFYVLYRNLKYGDPALRPVNMLLLAMHLQHTISFFAIFGAYQDDVGTFAKVVGFSVALNWGICKPAVKRVVVQTFKPRTLPAQAEPQAAN